MKADVRWTGRMAFDGHQDGHVLPLDADGAFGGQDGGPRPKTRMLTALGGCTGMDVVSILRKIVSKSGSQEHERTAVPAR